jgi:hypothetical protein
MSKGAGSGGREAIPLSNLFHFLLDADADYLDQPAHADIGIVCRCCCTHTRRYTEVENRSLRNVSDGCFLLTIGNPLDIGWPSI